jgi:two-component sensor histidine kinase/tetratricopeptide (TPR) repeat protein
VDELSLILTTALFYFKRLYMKKTAFILVYLIGLYAPVFAQHEQEPIEPLATNEKELINSLAKNTRGIPRVHALLKLGGYYIARPGYEQRNATKALQYAQEALQLSNSLNYVRGRKESLTLLGKTYVSTKDLAAAKKILQQLTDTSRVHILAFLAEDYWHRFNVPANLDTALQYANEIVRITTEHKRPDLKIEGLTNLAIIYYFKGDMDRAEENWVALIPLSRKYPDALHCQYVYGQLIALCYNRGKYEQVIEHSIKAMKAIREQGETEFSGLIYHNSGTAYNVLRQYDKAANLFKLGNAAFKKIGHNSLFWTSIHELTWAYHQLGRDEEVLSMVKQAIIDLPPTTKDAIFYMNAAMANCYTFMNDPVPAEKHYLNALDAGRAGMHQPLAYQLLISYYVDVKKFDKARSYLDTVWTKVNEKYPKKVVSTLHRLTYRCDSALANYPSAMAHLRRSKDIDDSTLRASTTRQMQELSVKYETEKKDADLRLKDQNILLLTRQSELQQKDFEQTRLRMQFDSMSREQSYLLISSQAAQKDKDLLLKQQDIVLLEKQSQLKQSSLQQANFQRNVTFGGIGLLAIIVLLLYNQYRSKQRRNKEISKKNEKLEQLVNEKEWLLKEIHHRVKNNLQTVVSLLESQSSYLEKDALQAVQSSQHRVYAMSLIHQKLYQENNMASINMSVYLPELVEYLADSFAIRQRIRFLLDIARINVDVSQAVPIGLILNEAITNSIKYAFPHEGPNEIRISMHYLDDKQVQLRIADNGIGIPAGSRDTKNGSLGIKLMNGLTEDIGGRFNIENDRGTVITVQFSKDGIIEHIKNNVTSAAMATS